jgi:hypothetical protein
VVAGAGLTARIDEAILLFNRRSLDLPGGLFSRHTQFLLNGVPFEARLGRPQSDPLILMLTRGAAGYRFAIKALQHAMPDAVLQRGDLAESEGDDGARVVRWQSWLSGHLRGSEEAADVLVDVELTMTGPAVQRAAVSIDPAALARLQDARLRA